MQEYQGIWGWIMEDALSADKTEAADGSDNREPQQGLDNALPGVSATSRETNPQNEVPKSLQLTQPESNGDSDGDPFCQHDERDVLSNDDMVRWFAENNRNHLGPSGQDLLGFDWDSDWQNYYTHLDPSTIAADTSANSLKRTNSWDSLGDAATDGFEQDCDHVAMGEFSYTGDDNAFTDGSSSSPVVHEEEEAQPVVKKRRYRRSNTPRGDAESFNFNIREFHSKPLPQHFLCNCRSNDEYRNLRVIVMPQTSAWKYLDEYTPVRPLESFRQRNNFTIKDCLSDPNKIPHARYYVDHVPEPFEGYLYSPKIRRIYTITEKGETKIVNEGLCPYCPNIHFGQLKNSNYGHHMAIQHGVHTNGHGAPAPINHCYYYYEKLNKVNWTNHIMEGVCCPVKDCRIICKISEKTRGNPNKLLDYLRHYKDCHKEGKLLDAKKRKLIASHRKS